MLPPPAPTQPWIYMGLVGYGAYPFPSTTHQLHPLSASQANGVRTPSIHLNREPSSSSIDVPERESMDAVAAAAAAGRAYEDFVPPHSTVTEPATHTLSVDLSAAGYKKEHIRVQLVRSHRLVVVRGERRVAGNRWSRFRLEHRVPDGCDLTGIHAKFEDGVVRVTMPGLKSGPSAGRQEPAAAKADARDGGVAHEKAGDHAQGEGEKEDERVRKQQEEERASAAVKDGGRLDKGDGIVRGEEAVAVPSRGGYRFLIPERRKLATTVVGTVLVLFSLGLFVRYSLAP